MKMIIVAIILSSYIFTYLVLLKLPHSNKCLPFFLLLVNNTAIYIVIGVVLGVFVISFVFIIAAYFYLKSKYVYFFHTQEII